ncbi:MAG: S8 family serine peptidase [Anaerolineae bacterium]
MRGQQLLIGTAVAVAVVTAAAGPRRGATQGAVAPPEAAAVAGGVVLDPEAVARARAAGRAPVIVRLRAQADLGPAYRLATKEARGRYVYETLRRVAAESQGPVVAWLAARGVAPRQFWVTNALAVEADEATLRALATRSDVAQVTLEGELAVADPPPEAPPPDPDALAVPDVAERGLREINADDVWRMGYEGEGAVVAVTDTGAIHTHPALAAAYRGAEEGHDYNWFDAIKASEKPVDVNSHGTHVTGIVVGKQRSRQIGVAPKAKWIACRLIEQRSGPDSAALACLQWVLAPTKVDGKTDPRPDLAPDVVNASWGDEPGKTCLNRTLQGAIRSLDAAGIVFVASAGNSGAGCQTVCVPGAFREVITVANYDVGSRRINRTSSRGPVKWPEGTIIKPDISAPGTRINSSIPPSRYGEKSGTSMAAPHITGVVALIVGARPEYKGHPELVRNALLTTGRGINAGRCGPGGDRSYNNAAGHGLVMADKAVKLALTATPLPTATATATATASPTATATATATPLATATPERGPTIFLPRLVLGVR